MKVLSIRDLYATLIKESKKLIETRSWKTDYIIQGDNDERTFKPKNISIKIF